MTSIPVIGAAFLSTFALCPACLRQVGQTMYHRNEETAVYQGIRPEQSGSANNEYRWIPANAVSPGYFKTVQIPIIVNGRDFTEEEDRVNSAGVVIVNQTMARQFWPGANPVGKRLHVAKGIGDSRRNPEQLYEVIGVVRDAGYSKVWDGDKPYVYFTLAHLGYSRPASCASRPEILIFMPSQFRIFSKQSAPAPKCATCGRFRQKCK